MDSRQSVPGKDLQTVRLEDGRQRGLSGSWCFAGREARCSRITGKED
jgi:hypothetical protein